MPRLRRLRLQIGKFRPSKPTTITHHDTLTKIRFRERLTPYRPLMEKLAAKPLIFHSEARKFIRKENGRVLKPKKRFKAHAKNCSKSLSRSKQSLQHLE